METIPTRSMFELYDDNLLSEFLTARTFEPNDNTSVDPPQKFSPERAGQYPSVMI
jgi:hypothetical protein